MTIDNQVLSVTPVAADTIRDLLEKRNLQNYALRVAVTNGGCSGMQYQMAFEETPRDQDVVVEMHGVRLLVDPNSLMYLEGSTVDFAEDLMGGGFRIENPNIVSSCGCGTSFKTKDSAGKAKSCSC